MTLIAFLASILGCCLLVATAAEKRCTLAKDNVPDWQWFGNDTIHRTTSLVNGVNIRHWPTVSTGFTDTTLVPPSMNRIEIPPHESFPSEGTSYWLEQKASYVITHGQASITMQNGTRLQLLAGDHFSSAAGIVHGPITNVGDTPLSILAMTVLTPRVTAPPTILPVESDAWPSQAATYYRDAPQGGGYAELPPIYECGEVKVTLDNKLLTGIDSLYYPTDCDFPMHYHPMGALYFVVKGTMTVIGDKGPHKSVTFRSGEGRWVRPGFAYTEFFAADTQILVMGAPPLPTVSKAPPGETLVSRHQVVLEVSYKNSQNEPNRLPAKCDAKKTVGYCALVGCWWHHGNAECVGHKCVCKPGSCSFDGWTCVTANTTMSPSFDFMKSVTANTTMSLSLDLDDVPRGPEIWGQSGIFGGMMGAVAGFVFMVSTFKVGSLFVTRRGGSISESLLS